MTAPAIDWNNLTTWGKPGHNVHVSNECGDRHTDEVEQP